MNIYIVCKIRVMQKNAYDVPHKLARDESCLKTLCNLFSAAICCNAIPSCDPSAAFKSDPTTSPSSDQLQKV